MPLIARFQLPDFTYYSFSQQHYTVPGDCHWVIQLSSHRPWHPVLLVLCGLMQGLVHYPSLVGTSELFHINREGKRGLTLTVKMYCSMTGQDVWNPLRVLAVKMLHCEGAALWMWSRFWMQDATEITCVTCCGIMDSNSVLSKTSEMFCTQQIQAILILKDNNMDCQRRNSLHAIMAS